MSKTNFCLNHKDSKILHGAICDRLIELEIMDVDDRPTYAKCWPYLVVLGGKYKSQGTTLYLAGLEELVEEVSLEDLYIGATDVYIFQLNGTTHELTKEQVLTIRDGLTEILEE